MMFSSDIAKATKHCLENGINFAVYAMPGSEDATFLADNGSPWKGDESSLKGFFINTFGNTLAMPVLIRPQWDSVSVLGCRPAESVSGPVDCRWAESTHKEDYIRGIESLTEELKHDGGKTVISRVICGDAPCIDWVKVADRYFKAFPSTFRFMYYTHATGAWIGATPEIILSRDSESSLLSTMSLAGTRLRCDKPWDSKNVAEHNFVTEYIVDIFRSFGMTPEVHEAMNVAYGDIEHLCHRITATYDGKILPLLDRLSPTPALAGVPLETAMRHISVYERHNRRCYGGYVGISDRSGVHAFVNLRSVNFDKKGYCIYAGGGITAASVASDEWDETEAKVKNLLSIIKSESHE